MLEEENLFAKLSTILPHLELSPLRHAVGRDQHAILHHCIFIASLTRTAMRCSICRQAATGSTQSIAVAYSSSNSSNSSNPVDVVFVELQEWFFAVCHLEELDYIKRM